MSRDWTPNFKHGQAVKGHESGAYKSYQNACARCNKPSHVKYYSYGGRGIQMKFVSFEDFYAALGDRPEGMTLDRIDPDGHYEPGNVRWATWKEQMAPDHNRRWPHHVAGNTTCSRGHEKNDKNGYVLKRKRGSYWRCRVCHNEDKKKYRARIREAKSLGVGFFRELR